MKRVIILFSAFTQLLFMLPLSAQESVQDSIIPTDSVQIAPVQAVKPSNACRFSGGFGLRQSLSSCSFRRRGAGGQGEQRGSKDKG